MKLSSSLNQQQVLGLHRKVVSIVATTSMILGAIQFSLRAEAASASAPSDTSAQTSPPQQTGAYRGHKTNVLAGAATFVAQFYQNGRATFAGIAPPAFGGGTRAELEATLQPMLCSMQRLLPPGASQSLTDWFAEHVATISGQRIAYVREKLTDANYCREPTEEVKAKEPISFTLDESGFPTSTNHVWNVCVKGLTPELTLPLIRSNPDRDEHGRALTCRDYHKGDMHEWYHPDLKIMFRWDPGTHALNVPQGYLVKGGTVAVTSR